MFEKISDKYKKKLISASIWYASALLWCISPRLYSSLSNKSSLENPPALLESLYDLLTMILSKLLNKSQITSSSKHKKIIFTSQNVEWKNVINPITKEVRKSDAFFSTIIDELKRNKKYELLGTYPIGSQISGLRILAEKRITWNVIHKPFNNYWLLDVWKEESNSRRHFQRLWGQLTTKENSLVFPVLAFHAPLREELSYCFKHVFNRIVKYMKMAERMIEEETPDLILLQNEYGEWEKSLILVAKLKGIPTLAVQHGIIYPHHPGYMHYKDEFKMEGILKNLTLPDKLAVFGEYTKNILINACNYPKDAVVVTGEPRYDILAKCQDIFNRNEFFKRYGLDLNKKIVLLVTQYSILSYNFLRAAIRTLKKFPEVQIVIKPHPGDVKYKWHQEVLKKESYDAIILNPKSNTYEAIFACDVIITATSTTAIEAMVLNKPVIIINLTGKSDPMPYVESGAALGAYKEEDIELAIKKTFFDEKSEKELKENRKKFVEDHLYNIGNATATVIKLIESMIEH